MSRSPTLYRFTGADYQPALDHHRLATHLETIRALMLDGCWRTAAEIAADTHLPVTSDITKQLRHLRYLEHGQHLVERRRRGEGRRGLYEYRVHPAGTGTPSSARMRAVVGDEDLEAARMTIDLLAGALRELNPTHPLLQELLL